MSIVSVHGPNMWGGSGAGGGGTGSVITAPQVQATADMTNGLKFTFEATDKSRAAADYDWAFPGGTPATQADSHGPIVVTYTTPGAKVATLTIAAGAGPPVGAAYPITVQADTAPGGVQVVDNAGGTVTGDAQNGALFTLAGKGDRNAADYDWTFSDGTAAIPNTKSTTVTFATGGSKTITLTMGSSGGTTPPASPPPYTFQVNATIGAQPRSVMPMNGESEEAPPEDIPVGYDPAAHTVAEVEQFVTDHPDEIQAIYDAEVAGKARTSLLTWLEENTPFDPSVHTIDDVKAFVEANPELADDVLAAEEDGKNRVTLVTWLEEFEA